LAHAMPLCLLRAAHCAHSVAQRVVLGIEVLYIAHTAAVYSSIRIAAYTGNSEI
jgi:hypothetical protein